MRFLFALVLLSVAVSLAVPVVCLVAEARAWWRKRRASRLAKEAADTERVLAYFAELREAVAQAEPAFERYARAIRSVGDAYANVKSLPGRRLAAVPEQRTGDAPYDVEVEGL